MQKKDTAEYSLNRKWTVQETFMFKNYLHDLLSCGEKGVPIKRLIPKVKRNDLCPCGSKKKYKKCCLNKNNS